MIGGDDQDFATFLRPASCFIGKPPCVALADFVEGGARSGGNAGSCHRDQKCRGRSEQKPPLAQVRLRTHAFILARPPIDAVAVIGEGGI